jgi:Xaa-Pro dipeptidase
MPYISIVGVFGVRQEDCVYMTADGTKWFSQSGTSISDPLA